MSSEVFYHIETEENVADECSGSHILLVKSMVINPKAHFFTWI